MNKSNPRMKKFKFPHSYADLDSAPWCDGYDPPKGQVSWDGDHLNIFVKLDWLPKEMHDTLATPGGPNLRWALMDLRRVWPYMRPPEVLVIKKLTDV